VRCIEILHVLLYWMPPVLFGTAAWLALRPASRGRPPDAALLALLAFAGFVYLGVFPRADFNHLANVYQPIVALGAVVAARLLARSALRGHALRRALVASGGALLGAYTLVAGYWTVDLLHSHDTAIAAPRGGVLVSRAEQEMLAFEVAAIRAGTRDGEPVLTLPGLAMLNFLAERPTPSRYTNLYAVHIAHDQGAGVVEGSELSGVQLAVADYDDFFSEHNRLRDYAPVLTDYLRRNFAPAFSVAIDEHLFLRRRPSPLPARETLDALADCDVGAGKGERRTIRQHLLFDILYHGFDVDPGEASEEVSTRCRIELPGPSELRFRVGTRQPAEVRPQSELVAELWAQRPGHADELLYRETLTLAPVGGWSSPPALERSVDLSRFAGEEAWLVFRSRFRGEVQMNPLDFTGFAMVWQDPRIELHRELR
jgi:prepilin signal peptidase PulO-like enzyme (type II secretory pathway)